MSSTPTGWIDLHGECRQRERQPWCRSGNPLIRVFSGLTFYLLLPVAMMLFAWKAAVFPAWGSGLLCVATGVVVSHVMLPFRRFSWRSKALLSISAAIISAAIIVGGAVLGFGPPRRHFDLFRANLSGQWLPGDDLRNADLRFANANLSDASLGGASLGGANLSNANLRGARLSGAHLSDANLSNADLSRADLSDAKLRYADLSRADLSHANLRYADLSNADLGNADLGNTNLSDANLSRADLSHAKLRFANLSGADLSHANLRYAGLSRADLSDAKLRFANLSGADLISANLSDADLRFRQPEPRQAEIRQPEPRQRFNPDAIGRGVRRRKYKVVRGPHTKVVLDGLNVQLFCRRGDRAKNCPLLRRVSPEVAPSCLSGMSAITVSIGGRADVPRTSLQ